MTTNIHPFARVAPADGSANIHHYIDGRLYAGTSQRLAEVWRMETIDLRRSLRAWSRRGPVLYQVKDGHQPVAGRLGSGRRVRHADVTVAFPLEKLH